MTVSELIEELRKYPQEAETLIDYHDVGLRVEKVCERVVGKYTIDERAVVVIKPVHTIL